MNTGFRGPSIPFRSIHRLIQSVLSQLKFSFYRHQPILADFSGGQITSDAGLLPLRAFDQRHGLTQELAQHLRDPRQSDRVRHCSLSLLRQRVYQIVAGYEDANDADRLVWRFDRFARSLRQLMSGLEMCRALGIDFVSVTESIDTSLPSGELVFQMIGAVAQFERSLIGERVKSGLANARARGKALGRPSLRKLLSAETRQLRQERIRQNVPFRVLARRFGVSVRTAHRLCVGHS